jgi:hypothetical protein
VYDLPYQDVENAVSSLEQLLHNFEPQDKEILERGIKMRLKRLKLAEDASDKTVREIVMDRPYSHL